MIKPKSKTKRGSYTKFRTFVLPKPYVDLLLISAHLTPLNDQAVIIGLNVINDIITKSHIFRENENYPFHVIPLYSKLLQTKYGNEYKQYLQWLVNHSVIWNDHPFEEYSSHYYLHSIDTCINLIDSKLRLTNEDLEEVRDTYCLKSKVVISSKTIDNIDIPQEQKNRIFLEWYQIKIPIDKHNKRFLVRDYEQDSKFIKNAPKHLRIMGSYYRNTLEIDFEGAKSHAEEKYNYELSQAKTTEEKDKAYKRYSSRIASIHAVKNGKANKSLRFNRNEKNKRLDTNLTNMASDLRPFIIGYSDLAYLDLVNSQPVLFNVLLRKHYRNASIELKRELDEYRESTTNGRWYEKLMEIFKVSRAEAKTIWMEIAYSQNKSYKLHKAIFKSRFPFISRIIEELKIDNHANFSIELQKIESKVFIDRICKALVDEGIVPHTMHDGLLVPKEHATRTNEIMLQELEKVIGARPTIKIG